MALLDFLRKPENRNLEDPNAPVSAEDFLQVMGWGEMTASAGVTVNIDTALGVPAVWAAVNFLSGTLAGLPLHVYRKTENGRQRAGGPLESILHDTANDSMSSFEWRKYMYDQVFTGGRCITYIERSGMVRSKTFGRLIRTTRALSIAATERSKFAFISTRARPIRPVRSLTFRSC